MDREKVIKGVHDARRYLEDREWVDKSVGVHIDALNDALELLKEQKAVAPITQSSVYDPDTWFYVCGSCKKGVIDRGDKFCRWCGKPVKRE